jgi:hypothetical protein
MTLPTFLGIGAPRAGTTWLHELLASHPDVYVPTRRKEVRFFDQYYERGLPWYEKFFPSEREAGQYQAIGEISPAYLYCPRCPERIASIPSITRLILMLRNPVDRAYSAYGLDIRLGSFSGPFEDCLSLRHHTIQKGFYSRQIRRYLRYFRRDQLLVLVFERAVADVPSTKETLACFVGIALDRFPLTVGTNRVNRSYIPRSRLAYALSTYAVCNLQKWDLDWVINMANRLGIDRERLFGTAGPLPPMKEETRQYLGELYVDEVRELESLLQIDLECWRK